MHELYEEYLTSKCQRFIGVHDKEKFYCLICLKCNIYNDSNYMQTDKYIPQKEKYISVEQSTQTG